MGELTKALDLVETAKSWFSIEKITGLINGLVDKIPDNIMAIYNDNKALCMFAAVCLLILISFEGAKIVRMAIFAGSAFLCGYLGFNYLVPYIPSDIKSMIPEMVDIKALCAIAGALVAVFICCFAYNFMIMILGGVGGYFLGSTYLYGVILSYFGSLGFLHDANAKHIVGGIVAVVIGFTLVLIFKPLLSVLTSFGFMTVAAVILQKFLVPTADESLKLSFIVLGLAVGVVAFIRQRKQESASISLF